MIKTGSGIFMAPAIGFAVALLMVLIVSWLFVKARPNFADSIFRKLQFVSASAYSLGHGGNDAQKTMGIIAALLYAHSGQQGGELHDSVLGGDQLPGGHRAWEPWPAAGAS